MNALLLQVVQAIDDLNLTPAKAVQLGNAKQVSLAEDRKAGTELMPLVQGRGAADLLEEDLLTSICFEVIDLGVGGLVGRADPGVSNFPSHRSERV